MGPVKFGYAIQGLLFFLFFAEVVAWIRVALIQDRLMTYLRKHHEDRWCELTSGPGWGPGGRNSLRAIPYLYNDQDKEDPRVASLKTSVRRSVLLALYVLAAMGLVILMPIIALAICAVVQIVKGL